MGSIVEYKCPTCRFTTGELTIGWGKAGRREFWGGLARCVPCREIGVVNLSVGRDERDRRCGRCNGSLALIDGVQASVACPNCEIPLGHKTLRLWS